MFKALFGWTFLIMMISGWALAQEGALDLQNNTVFEYQSGEDMSTVFRLPIPDDQQAEDLLLALEVYFLPTGVNRSVGNLTRKEEMAVTATTDDNSLIGTLTASTSTNMGSEKAASAMFCWGPNLSFLIPQQYILSVAHLPYAHFGIGATLLTRQLRTNVKSSESLPISSVWWFYDMLDDPMFAPLQFDFRGTGSGDQQRIASVFYGCPGPLSPSTLLPADRPGVIETFDEKARITVSKLRPELAKGRWFVNVIKNKTDMIDIKANFGTPYEDYPAIWGWTSACFVLLCPAICTITFFLVWWTQSSRQPTNDTGNLEYQPFKVNSIGEEDNDHDDDEEDEDDDFDDHIDDDHEEVQHLNGHDLLTSSLSNEDSSGPRRSQKPTHFWELTSIVGMVFFVPAVQILFSEMHEQGISGYRDICYYNDLCEKPTQISRVLFFAFNNVYSNIGYLIAGLTAVVYLTILRFKFGHWRRYMPVNYGSLASLCICLVFVGLNSAAYHLCPSRQSFQVDAAMQACFALLCIGDVWRRYFYPELHACVIFALLAFLLFLNYVGTIIDTFPPIATDTTPKFIFRLVLTLIIGIAAVGWLVFIWRLDARRPRRSYTTVLVLVVAPTIGLLWWNIRSDLSQIFLAICIVLFAVAILLDFSARVGLGELIETCRMPRCCPCSCPTRHRHCIPTERAKQRCRVAVLFSFLFLCWTASGMSALYFFVLVSDTNKDLTAQQSRNLNNPCVVAEYYSSHDLWHFLSAVCLLCSILIIGHLFHGKGSLFIRQKKRTASPTSYGSIKEI